PVIAGITGEGTKVAVEEARRAVDAGAKAGLVYPSHGWLRFGYQQGAPQDRYKAIYEETGLPLILFQYPDNTKANYNLDTQLEIAAQPGVFATKNGVRNMRRWDTEIPVLRRENPDLPRRVPPAHRVRHRRPARRLRQHRTRAAARPARRR